MLRNLIPFIDLRGKTLVDLLRVYPDRAKSLVMAARKTYGITSRLLSGLILPSIDRRSHKWLAKTNNPFLHEIETFDSVLSMRGVYALNLSYEWGCTSGAYRSDYGVGMMRVLDWPFPQLGKHAMVLLQSGKNGQEYYNVTWPGLAGVFNGMAPGRFCAALNLAPMRRSGKNIVFDWIRNRRMVRTQKGLPPSHLLRLVFENAPDYDTAKEMLAKTPIAVPAIFVLSGLTAGEGCVIERLETVAEIRDIGADPQVVASNQFQSPLKKNMPPRPFFNSEGRYHHACSLQGHEIMQENFTWLKAPILNPFTRLCIVADAGTGRLTVQGFEGVNPATEIFNIPPVTYAHKQAV